MQIIIVAGGGGTRLWPLSTNITPKQFVNIIGQESLLSRTYNNLLKDFKKENIWINTNSKYTSNVLQILPDFNPLHIIAEPEKRDSFAAVATSAAIVSANTSKDETLVFIPCDDWLSNEVSIKEFNNCQRKIDTAIQSSQYKIMIAGIKPTSPNINYGYIEIDSHDKLRVFDTNTTVRSFKEKPDLETAKHFLEQGNYLWNKFNFAFTYKNFARIIKNIDENVYKTLSLIHNKKQVDSNLFAMLPVIAFDFFVLEKLHSGLGVVGMDINWDDLGNWETVAKYLPDLEDVKGKMQLDGVNNKVKLLDERKNVAFVGVSNLLLIETESGILVVDPRNTGKIKDVAKYFDN